VGKAKKIVSEVPVAINELALSLVGWEVQDFRVRVTTEQYDDGECFHKLALSGVFRFNDEDWVDCFNFSREYPVHPVMLLTSSSVSDRPAVCEIYTRDATKGRPVRVADDGYFINTYRPLNHADLRVELTAYDSVDTRSGISDIPLQAKEIPLELVDESTSASVRLTFDQIEAFTHRKDAREDDTSLGQIRAAGRATFGSAEDILNDWVSTWHDPPRTIPTVTSKAPFSFDVPDIVFDVLDDSGFLLEQVRGDIGITVHVDEHGNPPSRVPRWLLDLEFDPDDYSAPPRRIIGRIGGS
jgi:hypothetical protein